MQLIYIKNETLWLNDIYTKQKHISSKEISEGKSLILKRIK